MTELFFFSLITFESAYKPPKRNRFSLFRSHTYFLPKLGSKFSFNCFQKSDSRTKICATETGQMSVKTSKRDSNFQSGFEPDKTHGISILIIGIPRQRITFQASPREQWAHLLQGHKVNRPQGVRRPLQVTCVLFLTGVRIYSAGSCAHCGQRDFSRDTGNLDVCVNSPDCKILSTKFRKTISLNTWKAKQNVTHLQGGPGSQATRMWPLSYAQASPVPLGTSMGNYKSLIEILKSEE